MSSTIYRTESHPQLIKFMLMLVLSCGSRYQLEQITKGKGKKLSQQRVSRWMLLDCTPDLKLIDELSALSKMSRGTIGRILDGEVQVMREVACAIAGVTEASVKDVLDFAASLSDEQVEEYSRNPDLLKDATKNLKKTDTKTNLQRRKKPISSSRMIVLGATSTEEEEVMQGDNYVSLSRRQFHRLHRLVVASMQHRGYFEGITDAAVLLMSEIEPRDIPVERGTVSGVVTASSDQGRLYLRAVMLKFAGICYKVRRWDDFEPVEIDYTRDYANDLETFLRALSENGSPLTA